MSYGIRVHSLCATALLSLLWGLSIPASARETVQIVGSSTVYPFATVVAERFGRYSKYAAPIVESTGSGGGLKLFCSGLGATTPDIVNSSRRIKLSEYQHCHKNGVGDIIEVKIGYDGIVIGSGQKGPVPSFSLTELYLALARQVPAPDGSHKLVDNPYHRWKQLNPWFPDNPIRVFGPPPTSGTRDALVELGLQEGCNSFAWILELKKSDPKRYRSSCHTVREDGSYIEAGENDNLILQKVIADPRVLGIFGFNFLQENRGRVRRVSHVQGVKDSVYPLLRGAEINGAIPTIESISDGTYPLTRPLYFYVKKAHLGIVPGLDHFVREFTSKRASGAHGYLLKRGLIPLNGAELVAVQKERRGRVKDWRALRL